MTTFAERRSARRVGLTSATIIVVVSLVITALLPPATFTGPVATFVLSYLPVQIALAGMWAQHPTRLAGKSRAARGGILLAVAIVIGIVVEIVFIATVGAGQGPSTPQIALFSIVTVVVAFWLAIVFEAWPFARISNGIVATVALLFSVYVITLLIYYLLFNFSFLPPDAQTPQTPSGLFNAWYILSFTVTAISAMFLPPAFGFLGFERVNQPVRGILWTALCLVWAAVLFGIGVGALGFDPVDFLIWVPVPLLFGGLDHPRRFPRLAGTLKCRDRSAASSTYSPWRPSASSWSGSTALSRASSPHRCRGDRPPTRHRSGSPAQLWPSPSPSWPPTPTSSTTGR